MRCAARPFIDGSGKAEINKSGLACLWVPEDVTFVRVAVGYTFDVKLAKIADNVKS